MSASRMQGALFCVGGRLETDVSGPDMSLSGKATIKMRFKDREEAGIRLSQALFEYKHENPLVIGLARGGVPVAFQVAHRLEAPLEVMVARKIGAPHNPELGIGAIAPGISGHVIVLNEELVARLGVTEAYLQNTIAKESAVLAERLQKYRDNRPWPDLREQTVILVDDGIATGITAQAAIRALRQQAPRQIVLAVPVCAQESVPNFRKQTDEYVCLMQPVDFMAVGLWYEEFNQTSDDEVLSLLAQNRREISARTAS